MFFFKYLYFVSRDREYQILKIEEARHRSREKEHGKNYLLETYLNGFHDDGDNKESGTGHSDSGVNTEDAPNTCTPTTATSPEVGTSLCSSDAPQINSADTNDILNLHFDSNFHSTNRKSVSKREIQLLKEHECSKQLVQTQSEIQKRNDDGVFFDADGSSGGGDDDSTDKIEWLEKVFAINKHLQREEELVVRLTAKVRKYESDDRTLTQSQIKDTISRLDSSIDASSYEIEKLQREIEISGEMMEVKRNVIVRLSDELDRLDIVSKDISDSNNASFHTNIDKQQTENGSAGAVPMQYAASSILASTNAYSVPNLEIFNQNPLYFQKKDCEISANNLLQHFDQRNLTGSTTTMTNMKVGPKKLLNGFYKDPDSDTGLSSLGEDGSLLGTLV